MSDGHSEAAKIAQEEAQVAGDPQEQGNGIKYGISVFEMDDGRPVIHITGDPDVGQLQRLMAGALANLESDITARKVVQMLAQREQATKIIRPGG